MIPGATAVGIAGDWSPLPKPKSDYESIEWLRTLRALYSKDLFIHYLIRKESRVYALLAPYGFQGSWERNEDYLPDFDAAIERWREQVKEEQRIADFPTRDHKGAFFFHNGFFQARYSPSKETLTVTVPVHFTFEDSKPKESVTATTGSDPNASARSGPATKLSSGGRNLFRSPSRPGQISIRSIVTKRDWSTSKPTSSSRSMMSGKIFPEGNSSSR